MNVILDLDETIINTHLSRTFTPRHFKRAKLFHYKMMSKKYIVIARPGLEAFLDWLFANFTVSVWTAATRAYAFFVIKYFIMNNPNRVPLYIFSSEHCCASQKKGKSHKDLSILYKRFPHQYSPHNTVIIDDREDICEHQKKNSYCIPPFFFLKHKSYNDMELKKVKKFLKNFS
uniref:Haloacid dehalogenase-like hydrolase n=1 Tax=Heteronotia binoei irido-like virus TaxID=3141948 RepID=A0AAU7SSF6_9VIRU